MYVSSYFQAPFRVVFTAWSVQRILEKNTRRMLKHNETKTQI